MVFSSFCQFICPYLPVFSDFFLRFRISRFCLYGIRDIPSYSGIQQRLSGSARASYDAVLGICDIIYFFLYGILHIPAYSNSCSEVRERRMTLYWEYAISFTAAVGSPYKRHPGAIRLNRTSCAISPGLFIAYSIQLPSVTSTLPDSCHRMPSGNYSRLARVSSQRNNSVGD